MRKKLLYLFCTMIALISCSIDPLSPDHLENKDNPITKSSMTDTDPDLDRPIILGEKLENPYAVSNMRKAYTALQTEGIGLNVPMASIKATDYYDGNT